MGAGDGGQEGAGLPGLTAELVGEDMGLIAQPLADGGGGGAELPHASSDDGLYIVQLLGGLLVQKGAGLAGQGELVLLRDGPGLGAGGAVRIGGAGGDHVQGIPQNVGQNDGIDLGRGAQLGEAAPLHRGQALSDGIHLHNVRPTGQQGAGELGQLLRRDQGALKQGGAAAGDQQDHGILGREVLDQLHGRPGPPEGALVRYRVPPFKDLTAGDVTLAVSMLGDHHALFQPGAQQLRGTAGHLPGGLAQGD